MRETSLSECAYIVPSNVADIGGSDGNGDGNISVLPTFVNANEGDFHLSMSDGASRDVENLTPPHCDDGTCVDYDGDARPVGEGYDMGADEYIPPM